MAEVPAAADVVICGAGMAGISTAYWLARSGVRGLVLVDRRSPMTLTSDKSAETFRIWWPGNTSEDKFALLARSVELIWKLVRESDGSLRIYPRGHCHVTTDRAKVPSFRRRAEEYAALEMGPLRVHGDGSTTGEPYDPNGHGEAKLPQGVDLLLDRGLIDRHFPYLSSDTAAILHDRCSGYFSGHTLGMHLLQEAKALGVRELRGEVVAVDQDQRGVSAVRVATEAGLETISTRTFVNAAGPFAGQVGAMLGVQVPVETGLWEKIVIDDYLGIVPRSAPVLVLHDRQHLPWSEEEKAMWRGDEGYRWLLDELPDGVYMRPEGGGGSHGVLIGWAYNECPFGKRVEWDHEVGREGAGAFCDPQWEPRLSKEFPELALRAATRLVPGLLPYLERMPTPMHDGGYFVMTEGQIPLVGPLGVDGAYIVLHDGMVMAGCAAGELCGTWITGSTLPPYAKGLSLARFGHDDGGRAR